MTFLFVCTDDVYPESIVALWQHWDHLKRLHPALKVTCFVPGRFHNVKRNDIYSSQEFAQWYKERKDWVEVAAHGLYHEHPPEFTKFSHHQEKIARAMTIKLHRFFPDNPGFKAPFYRMNHKTMDVVASQGYSYVALLDSIIFLRPMVNAQLRNPYVVVNSHTSLDMNNPVEFANKDNINLIRLSLHRQLKRYEKRNVVYSTISEYIQRYRA